MGVTPAAISRAISSGRFPKALSMQDNGRYLIDVEVGRAEFEDNRLRSPRNAPIEEDLEDGQDADGFDSILVIEKRQKHFQAELSRLKFEEQAGQLLNADEVKSEAFKTLRLVRDGLLSIPDRVASELAAEKDPFSVRKRLDEEIRNVLQNLSFQITAKGSEPGELDPEPEAETHV